MAAYSGGSEFGWYCYSKDATVFNLSPAQACSCVALALQLQAGSNDPTCTGQLANAPSACQALATTLNLLPPTCPVCSNPVVARIRSRVPGGPRGSLE
jgi:hypothetical protein